MPGQSSPHPLWFVFGGLLLVGGVLAVTSVPGERAKRAAWLAQVRAEAVVITSDRIDPANEGRWVLLTADAGGMQETFTDPAWGVTRTCFSLTRHGETYYASGEESSGWVEAGPNAPADLKTKHWRVEHPRLGAFAVSDELLHGLFLHVGGIDGVDQRSESNSKPPDWAKRLDNQQRYRWPLDTLPPNPDPPRPGWYLMRDNRHWGDGADPRATKGDDRRIGYSCAAIPDAHVTVLTRQTGDILRGVPTGRGFELFTAVRPGALTLDDMIGEATREHERRLDGQRTAGWVFAAVGAALIAAGVYFATRRRKIIEPVKAHGQPSVGV